MHANPDRRSQMHKIGVDRDILPVRDFLRNAGYEVA